MGLHYVGAETCGDSVIAQPVPDRPSWCSWSEMMFPVFSENHVVM